TGDAPTLKNLFRSAVPSAIAEGDTVHVTAGTWHWGGPLVAGWTTTLPGFTFEGADTSTASNKGDENGTTVFLRETGYQETNTEFGGLMVFSTQASSGLTTFKEFTIDFNNPTTTAGSAINLLGSGLDKFRVHHVTADKVKFGRCFTTWGNQNGATGLPY